MAAKPGQKKRSSHMTERNYLRGGNRQKESNTISYAGGKNELSAIRGYGGQVCHRNHNDGGEALSWALLVSAVSCRGRCWSGFSDGSFTRSIDARHSDNPLKTRPGPREKLQMRFLLLSGGGAGKGKNGISYGWSSNSQEEDLRIRKGSSL